MFADVLCSGEFSRVKCPGFLGGIFQGQSSVEEYPGGECPGKYVLRGCPDHHAGLQAELEQA